MTPLDLLALYDETMRCNASVAGCTREQTAQSSRYSTASGSLRYIMWHQFSAADTDRYITDEIAAATGNVKALMWKVYGHDLPAHLGERLLAHGFTDHDPCALMAAPVTRVLAALGDTPDQIEEHDRDEDRRRVETQTFPVRDRAHEIVLERRHH